MSKQERGPGNSGDDPDVLDEAALMREIQASPAHGVPLPGSFPQPALV